MMTFCVEDFDREQEHDEMTQDLRLASPPKLYLDRDFDTSASTSSSTSTTTTTITVPTLSTSSTFLSSSTSITTVALPTTSIPPASTSTLFIPAATTTSALPTKSPKCVIQYVSHLTIPHIQTPETNFEPPSLPRFFSNKGEVTSVFTVVSLVGLAVLITLVTTCIRRRRAEKFDRDVAEAIMQAAATSHSANFDDYGYGI
ncbi:hypothetical protein PILCRDRAFT_5115 [Piloderma croceum F 1598]|uniref:REJ domain-containing protein n=1 Tax=Piloderma croceum (strain F 1598) TaxID=765440 RepID=A0A0C3C8L0_PILCF|nr:hypothetical protein PILCRDRAFT_5115 [Piloderma croceum F 1598]